MGTGTMNNQQRKFLVEELTSKFIQHNSIKFKEEETKLNAELESLLTKCEAYAKVDAIEVYITDEYQGNGEYKSVLKTKCSASVTAPPSLKNKINNVAKKRAIICSKYRTCPMLTGKQRQLLNDYKGELLFTKADYTQLSARLNDLFEEGTK